jgi:hypothetical protein
VTIRHGTNRYKPFGAKPTVSIKMQVTVTFFSNLSSTTCRQLGFLYDYILHAQPGIESIAGGPHQMKASQSTSATSTQLSPEPQHPLNGFNGPVNGVVKRKSSETRNYVNGRPSKKLRRLTWMDVTDNEVSTSVMTNNVVRGNGIVSPGRHERKHSRNSQGSAEPDSKLAILRDQRQLLPIAKGADC